MSDLILRDLLYPTCFWFIQSFWRSAEKDSPSKFELSLIDDYRLDTAVPASLDDMVDYQKALAQVHDFANNLDALKWPGVEGLRDWVTNAPKIWLTKKRESVLDWTRNQFSLGTVFRAYPASQLR